MELGHVQICYPGYSILDFIEDVANPLCELHGPMVGTALAGLCVQWVRNGWAGVA